jgi:hypothetical protein
MKKFYKVYKLSMACAIVSKKRKRENYFYGKYAMISSIASARVAA